jgi:hypothetical protein
MRSALLFILIVSILSVKFSAGFTFIIFFSSRSVYFFNLQQFIFISCAEPITKSQVECKFQRIAMRAEFQLDPSNRLGALYDELRSIKKRKELM